MSASVCHALTARRLWLPNQRLGARTSIQDVTHLAPLLEALSHWARSRTDIVGLALVGSHARDAAGPTSDVDVVIVTSSPDGYRANSEWVSTIPWPRQSAPPAAWRDAEYGAVWSRHLRFADGVVVELTFAAPQWAKTDPVDSGTRQVVGDGCRIVWDPQGVLGRLLAAVRIGE